MGEIPKEILDKHWEYFENSIGYKKIEEYKNQNILPSKQRALFRIISNHELLKKIIIGKPSEIRELIDQYNEVVINKGIIISNEVFSFYKDFIVTGGWNSIWLKINREAWLSHKKNIKARMIYLDKRFSSMEMLYGLGKNDRLNIGVLKSRFNNINNNISSNLESWNDLLKSIFDYSKFIEINDNWNAYKYTTDLGITVCPYCNRNYIHTLETDSGRTRAELDHFYPKSLYPFLSISIYNLIPSCHICNSNLKGSKNFFEEQHMHPFENLNQSKITFKLHYTDLKIETVIPNTNQFEIDFDFSPSLKNSEMTMINNSLKTFKTKELYNNHKDIAQELIYKAYYYNRTKIEELQSILGDNSGIDENFIERIVYGNYIHENNFGKRPLAKFTGEIISNLEN
ncbi:hypothetical protein [Chryseobacterium formosense]|uniref:hypothetical protein n=1 Tax=Chryseobacterium formosense TaxID=236814 RepID=UPI00103ABB00|nr:hypothetical protein [Chryseobacterium formosense]